MIFGCFSGGRTTSGGRAPARRHPPFDVPPLVRVLPEATPRNVKGLPQHELEVFLRAVTSHGNLFTTDLDVDAHAEVVPALVVAMGNVGDDVAGNDPRADRVEFACTFADFGFNERVSFLAGERDRNRLPHA
jgi:hypothetical protein